MYSQKTIRVILAITFLLWGNSSFALSVSPLGGTLSANGLITELIDTSNSQITVSGIKYQGAYQAAGIFSNGMGDGLGIDRGVILTTGNFSNAIGPNKCYKTTTVNRKPGDSGLNTLGQGTTYDASVLEFDFIPQGDTLKFEYVFTSEEYPEWVGSKFNDIFAFFLDNQNIAIVPKSSTPVAINTINKWSNSQYYYDNEYPSPSNVTDYNKNNCIPGTNTPFLTEFDGFTTVLSAVAKVTPGKKHHMKLAIADRGDFSLDSAVFIKGKSFTLVLPPPATTLISPAEIIYTNTPTFGWHEVSSATIYELQLVDANHNVLIDNKYFSDEIACDSQAGSCSVTPGTSLADGTYQWQVKTQNQAGGDLWSNTLSFTVKTLPDPATLVAPLENIIKCSQLPTYQWQPAALATRYLLHVKDAGNQVFEQWYNASEVNCVDQTKTCSVTPAFQPAEGSVQWQIKTANPKGEGPWSTTGSFTMRCPPPATTLVPSSSTGNPSIPGIGSGQSASGIPLPANNPTSYSWQAVPSATLYQLQIKNQQGQVVVEKSYPANSLNCSQGQGVCTVNLAVDLPDGNYQWQILTGNEVGEGTWSQALPMTIKMFPDAATLISPTGTLLNCQQKPTYSWQVAYLATQYLLSVQDALGVTTEHWYSDIEANCTTTTCSVTPDFPVVEGNVQWRVKTANSKGDGPWSATFAFTVKCPPPPTTPSAAIPATNSNLIAYSWKTVPSATLYQLQVKNSQGQVLLKKWYSATSLNCNSGQPNCSVNVGGLNLPDGTYYWNVQTRNEVGYGAWSNTLPLIIKTLPDAATLVSPLTTLLNCTQTLTYSWKPANLATRYLLSVQNTSQLTEQWYSMTEANCTDTLCSVTPSFNVVEGNVNWRVKTANAKGEGPWSEAGSFAVKCPPPATTLVSPTGVINDNTPTYTWNIVPAATTYRLQVLDANNQIVVDETSANCNVNQGVCSFTPNPKLLDGNYSWKVLTQNQVGPGAWSAAMPMTIKVLPNAASLISPTQTFVNCNQSPTYSWKPAYLATRYLLAVQGNLEVVERWYSSTEANCTLTDCSITPDFKPAEGSVSWRIKATNPEGEAPWSEALSFTMKCPPAVTTLISSGGATSGNTLFPPVGTGTSLSGFPPVQSSAIAYKWQAVPGATLYQLQIKDEQGQAVMKKWYSATSLNCSSPGQEICSVNVNNLNLPDGNYQWQVQTRNEVSSSAWSSPSSFNVKTLPDATNLISPAQTLVNCNQTPTYSWQPAALATQYLLSIQDNQGTTERWYSAIEANCTATLCSVTPDFQTAEGNIQWQVKAANLKGEAPWSETLSFVVQCPPLATTLVSPSEVIRENRPTYIWNTMATATTYQLQVTNADNQVVVEETISNCHSEQETCSFSPITPLTDGNYSWNIQTQNQVGNGQWSQALSFTVLTTPLVATLVSPQVTLHHNLPTYTWQTVPKATQYLMRVQDASGQVFETTYTSAAANCSEETQLCSVTPDKELAEGETQWWIQTANSSGLGPLSAAMSFAIEKVTTCKLYAVNDEQLNDSQFLVIDLQSTAINALGALYVDHDIEALDASLETEQLYAASGKDALLPGVLYTVDSSTGQLNLLGDLGVGDVSGLSFNPMTGQLWGWSPGNGLFWIDVNQLSLLPQFEWLSTMRIDDLTWNEEGTVLYLAQRNKLLRYEGNKAKPTLICTLPEERKIEALEMTPGNVLLMGIDGKDIVYSVEVDSNKNCVIEPFDTLETPYQDIEGMTLGCARHYVVE